ncbi:MAG TPA: hypothetical protein EYP03_00250 [Aquificae bacterium]|nr:hypothetical protein [Aquificota bacterium]
MPVKKLIQVKELLEKQQSILKNKNTNPQEREKISKDLIKTLAEFIDFIKQNPNVVHEYPDLISEIQKLASENKSILERTSK